MAQEIRLEIPANAFLFLLKSVPCEEAILRPRHTVTEENAAQEYLRARDLWTEQGWVELDFDGSLRPGRPLARLLYTLVHRYAVLRWERDGMREFYVKGPVDLLHIVEEAGRMTMAQEPSRAALEHLREELSACSQGTLEVLRISDQKALRVSLEGLTPGEEALKASVEALKLFYEEAESNA